MRSQHIVWAAMYGVHVFYYFFDDGCHGYFLSAIGVGTAVGFYLLHEGYLHFMSHRTSIRD